MYAEWMKNISLKFTQKDLEKYKERRKANVKRRKNRRTSRFRT